VTWLHLTASTFFGGPERQTLGLARALSPGVRSHVASFAEGGRCEAYLDEVRAAGFDATRLTRDTPRLAAAVHEIVSLIRRTNAAVLFTHTYKPHLLGRFAAKRAGIPHVVVSRGWTGENAKVRLYERLDRWNLRHVDRVAAVSDGQAKKVLATGCPPGRVTVIRNAARVGAFGSPHPSGRETLLRCFRDTPVSHVVCAAGRLSPEKGFDVLVDAAPSVLQTHPSAGFVVFGDGFERPSLEARAKALGGRFVFAGFTAELDRLLPHADVVVLPSRTEGLPNVALEASAAGVPVVATAVGGTPEVIADGETGFLVPSEDASAMADRIGRLLADVGLRRQFGDAGRRRMCDEFSFAAQARQYLSLVESLRPSRRAAA
jgi:glycosyltransferase involved in cell wall biosynthesis